MTFGIDATVVEQIKGWTIAAGKLALENQHDLDEQIKADDTPVTNVDTMVERFLVEAIHTAFPDHQVIGEEASRIGSKSDWLWALDPIDGTKSYMRKLPVWGVSLGLLYRGAPAAGVVYLPVTGDLYWGWQGGAFWNGSSLSEQPPFAYDSSLTFLAVHSMAHQDNEILYPRIQAFGSTAAHLAFLAAGKAAGVLARRVHIWDVAGALPILQQAGYAVQYLSGRPLVISDLFDGSSTREQLVATRPEWMERLRGDIRKRIPDPFTLL